MRAHVEGVLEEDGAVASLGLAASAGLGVKLSPGLAASDSGLGAGLSEELVSLGGASDKRVPTEVQKVY